MPPKPFGLGLALQIPPEDAAQNGQSDSNKKQLVCAQPLPAGQQQALHSSTDALCHCPPPQQDSWDVFGDSVTIMSKSVRPYNFSSEGLIRAPKGQEAPLHFKVSAALHQLITSCPIPAPPGPLSVAAMAVSCDVRAMHGCLLSLAGV